MRKYFSRLRARNWAWLHFLAAVGIAWPIYMIVAPPQIISWVLDSITLDIAMTVSLIGTVIAMFGYFASQQLEKLRLWF